MSEKCNARTIAAFDAIMGSRLFRIDGPDIDLCAALVELAAAIDEEPESEGGWIYLGEGDECTASDLVIGAYWALTEWYAGQNSPEYAAMCALGRIFSPGMSSGPEEGSGEMVAYEQVDAYFRAKNGPSPKVPERVQFSSGGTAYVPDMPGTSEVRAHYPQADGTTLIVVLTTEGVVIDLVGADGEVIATDSETADEIATRLS
jgi:hypothetical protein